MIKYGFLFCFLLIGCKQDPPNIVFIISDDQAWTDYGFMGHPHIETPNIDKLASEGLTFTRGYLPAPICRLTLGSMLTGLHPHQHGVTGNDPAFEFDRQAASRSEWLQAREPLNQLVTERYNDLTNLAKYLSETGYLSLQTGKWWEGSWQDAGFTHGMTHGDITRGGRHGDEGLKIGREGMELPIPRRIPCCKSTWQRPLDVRNPAQSLEHRMVMKSPWKLILPNREGQPQAMQSGGGGDFMSYIGKPELYNLDMDPHEQQNLAPEHPEVVHELRQLIDAP